MKHLLSLLGTGLLASPAMASVLMLDFGPTAVSGSDRSNSPYHTANILFTDLSWNQIQTADVLSGLLWSDGTAATGLALNLGATTATGQTTLGLGNTPSGNNALATATNTGVYAGTSVGRDAIFTGSSGTRYVGFQLSGLAAGSYDIYVTSRNTNTSGAYGQTLYAGASSTAGDFNATALSASTSLSFTGSSDATGTWAEADNYMKLSVTLAAGDYLNLAVTGSGSELRGFLNSVQIVSVPEPSAGFLLAIGLVGCCLLRQRHRRFRSSVLLH